MATIPVTQAMTADQFLALPERTDARRLELVDGEVVVNQPLPRHVRIQQRLLRALWEWSDAAAGRGYAWMPLDVGIDERNVYAPDVHWYAEGRGPGPDDRPAPRPNLAVEVRSASTWRYDVGAKKAGYERSGVPELWLIDTAADVVLIFRRSSPDAPSFDIAIEVTRDEPLTSPQLPGFELPVEQLLESD